MKINGKPKTPIIAAQSKKKDGGEKARTSHTAAKKNNGVKSAVLERISDGVLALDAGLNYEYLNERAGELLGCTPGDLIGKSLWQAHPGVEATPFAEACRRALETRSVVMLDGYFPSSDRWLEGRVYPSETGVSVLFSEGGRQKLEENRRREERYRILFDTMQEGFLLAELVQGENGAVDARLLEVNASMSRFLNKARDELVGKTVREVFELDEDDLGVLERAGRVARGEVEPFFLERYETAADCWLRAHIFSPRAGQFASLVTDITEQKQAELRLQDVSKFPGENPNPVMRFTPAGEILYANQASRSLLNAWENRETHTTPLEQVRDLLSSVMESGLNREIEVANDRSFYMGLLVPVREEGYINLYLRDITERMRAEEMLRAHIHQTNAGITRTDLEGRLTFVNQAFCDMLGYPESELVGRTIWEISHPDDIARNRTMFESLVREGESYQLEKRVLRRNGSFLWINVGSSPLRDASGRIQAATSIIVDITRRKRAEESLLESARRTLYLSSLGDAMHSLSDPSKIQIEAARLLGASLRASRVAYVEIEPDGSAVVRDNYVDNVPGIIGQFPIEACIPAEQMSRFLAGRTVNASDIRNDTRFDEAQMATHEALVVRAQVVVPFLRNGELIGALCVQQDEPRIWRNDEISLVEETAERLQAEIERAHAERRLRESERRFQQAASAAGALVYEVDVLSGAVTIVQGMQSLTGYDPQETPMSSAWWNSQIHPDDLPVYLARLEKLLATGGTDVCEYQIRHQSGRWVTIQDNRMVVQGEADSGQRLIGTVIDITERKQMENAVRESEERFRALVSQTTAGIAESSLEGRFTFVNPRFCEMLGYSEQELLGKTIFELTYRDDRDENKRLFERLAQEGEPYQLEKRFVRRDGSLLWVSVSVTTIYDLQGQPRGGVGVIIDIDQRKQAEESLRSSEERMRLAIESNRMVAWEWNPALDRVTTIGNLPEVYGLSEVKKEAEGFALIWPDDLPSHREKVERVMRQGGEYISEFRITRPVDGRTVWMEERAAALTNAEGRISRLAGVVTDVTERKRAEQELAEFARQQEALYQLAERLNRSESPQDVYDPALDAILNALQCDRASILLYDQADVMRFVAWRGLSDAYRQATDGHSPWKPDAVDPQPIAMQDTDTAELDDALRSVIRAEGIGALAFIPLVTNGKLIGKFMVYFNAPHAFEEDELELGLTIARQLASSIERKRAEEAVRASDALYRAIARSIPEGGVYVVDRDFRYKVAEGPVTEAFGLTRDMLEGRTVMEAFPDERGQRMEERLRRNFAGEIVHFETRFNGRVYWTQQAPLLDSKGQVLILTLDITERKRAEEAMAADLANMQILRDLGARLVTEGDLDVIYQEFVQAAIAITHADAGTVQILDEDSQEMILLATQGLDQGMIEHFHRVKAGSGTSCGIALARRERAFVDYDDPAMEDPDGSLRKHVEAGLFSAQSTPLISRSGVPIGMISTHWREHHRPTEQELRYLDLLARQATDLIERRLGDEALRASEQRFARFMQHLPGLAWLKNMEGRYVYANAAAEKAFGVSGQDLYGKRDEDIFPPYIASEFKKNDELALLDENGIQVVETLEQENKVLHYSLVSKFPVPGPDGRPALIGGTALDITERIHMEEALQSAREHAEQTADRIKRLQKVTASLSDVLTPLQVMQVIVDQGGPSLAAETSTILLLTDDGQKLEIVYSSAQKQLVQPYQSFPISLQVPAADAVRSGQPVWIESRQQYLERYPHLAEQIERWGLEAALAIPMKHKGRTLGVLTLSFDHVLPHSEEDQEYILTLARQGAQSLGRARAEEALRESEERYRAIISQATAGIVRKDANGQLLFVNQAFCNMLGMTAGELIGKTMWDLTHEDDKEENKRLYNRLMEEGTPFQLEKRLIRMDGSTLWVNVSVSPVMGESGKPHSAVSVYADINRRKHAENRLMLLARVSELTRQYEEPDELLYAVTREVGDYFQVRRALFNEIDVENDREVIHRDYCRDAESVAGVHRISDYSSATSVEMMIGKTVVNDDSRIDPRTAQEYERSYVPYGERAYVAVPLMDEDRWVASLWISDDKPRQWDKDDVYLLEAIAERTWTAAEKMRVDRALRDSEERLRVTFNTTAVGFALLTPETRFEDVNDALCQIVGYTRKELLSMTLDTLIHPDFIRSTQEHISRLLDGETSSFTIEKLYIRGDGAEVWVQNSISLVRDPDENPLHLIAICQDITERKREEEALRARTEEIETLMNVSPIGIFVANDPECRFISANPAGYRLLEMPDISQLNISKSAPVTEQPGYRVFRDGIEVAAEDMPMQAAARHGIELKEDALELRFENGTRKYIYAFAKPLFDAKGRSRGAIAAMLDISERKRTEEELHQLNLQLEERVLNRTAELQAAYEFLRESEATSRLILESMPDAIVITDREGRIVHANTQVETLFGYSPNEVLGKSVEMLIPERFRNRHLKNRDMYSGQRTRRIMGLGFDLFGRRKDESEFPVDVMLSPINNNTSWDVMVSIRDNTKQREAQEALRVNEEKLRTLFEILPVGISFLGKEGRIVDMNPALTEILGMSKEELLQGAFKARRYIRSDGMPMSPKEFASRRAIAENKTIYNVETGIVQPNGEIKWTSVNAAPVQVEDVEVVVVTIDITDRKQSEEAIHRHRESLKLLSRRLVEVQEDERHAIARELHDRVGQNLAALTLNLNILRSQLTKENLEKVGTRLNDSVTLVKDVLAITRSVMADLRPNVLDDYGLDAALNEYADRYSQRFGIQVVNSMPATPTPRLDPGIEMTLLRIAQEALTNIARHAQASQASMTLAIEDDAAHLVIEDNGIGILSWQKVNQPGSHGIRIMRERAEAFGGDLKVHSAYKNGTKIEVKIPFGGSASRNKTTQEKRS